MTHKIKLGDGTEIELTDAQAKFAFCWVNKGGDLLCNPNDLIESTRKHIETHGDCSALHHDD